MSNQNLLKQINLFCKLAATDFEKAVSGHATAIQAELSGGISSLNRLITSNPKAAASQALQAIDDVFGRLGSYIQNLKTNSDPESVSTNSADALTDLNSAAFYTSQVNAGTGYDPLVWTGGAGSPAGYLGRIRTYVTNLKSYADQMNQVKPIPAPSDPSSNIA